MSQDENAISIEEALKYLVDEDPIHTYVNPSNGMLLGASWDRNDVISCWETFGVMRAGKEAVSMSHGLVTIQDGAPVFFETKPNAFENDAT